MDSTGDREWLAGAVRAVLEGDEFGIRTSALILRPVTARLCTLAEAQGVYTILDLIILNLMVEDAPAPRPSNEIDF